MSSILLLSEKDALNHLVRIENWCKMNCPELLSVLQEVKTVPAPQPCIQSLQNLIYAIRIPLCDKIYMLKKETISNEITELKTRDDRFATICKFFKKDEANLCTKSLNKQHKTMNHIILRYTRDFFKAIGFPLKSNLSLPIFFQKRTAEDPTFDTEKARICYLNWCMHSIEYYDTIKVDLGLNCAKHLPFPQYTYDWNLNKCNCVILKFDQTNSIKSSYSRCKDIKTSTNVIKSQIIDETKGSLFVTRNGDQLRRSKRFL